jgi:hypothetical protein
MQTLNFVILFVFLTLVKTQHNPVIDEFEGALRFMKMPSNPYIHFDVLPNVTIWNITYLNKFTFNYTNAPEGVYFTNVRLDFSFSYSVKSEYSFSNGTVFFQV